MKKIVFFFVLTLPLLWSSNVSAQVAVKYCAYTNWCIQSDVRVFSSDELKNIYLAVDTLKVDTVKEQVWKWTTDYPAWEGMQPKDFVVKFQKGNVTITKLVEFSFDWNRKVFTSECTYVTYVKKGKKTFIVEIGCYNISTRLWCFSFDRHPFDYSGMNCVRVDGLRPFGKLRARWMIPLQKIKMVRKEIQRTLL